MDGRIGEATMGEEWVDVGVIGEELQQETKTKQKKKKKKKCWLDMNETKKEKSKRACRGGGGELVKMMTCVVGQSEIDLVYCHEP